MADPRNASRSPVRIAADGAEPVVLTPTDFDRFVMTQREVIDACRDSEQATARKREVGDQLAHAIEAVIRWCRARPSVVACSITPRMDDLLMIVVVDGEDPSGELHDAMCQLDLELFQENQFRFYWLLLRTSEASGIDAFSDPSTRKLIFRRDVDR